MDINALINQCYYQLPPDMRARPWEATDHGRAVLQTAEQLNAYLAAYGEMHFIKCKAALQNFPFEELSLYTFEIFDWGCGQGIATLTLLEMLHQRNKLLGLKKITLIEPSKKALQRATQWVNDFVPQIEVVAVNKFIPNSKNEVLDEVSCKAHFSINLFSNILDIQTLNLGWLAEKTSLLAPINYMICVGPYFRSGVNTRIADFCGYFPNSKYFSKIDSYPYAYTSHTNHPFGCQTRCFVHKKDDIIDQNYQEYAEENELIDPYENVASFINYPEEVQNFYAQLLSKCSKSYSIFAKASIGVTQVDFLLVSQTKGIIIINVCTDINQVQSEFDKLENIKKEILLNHLGSMKIDLITNQKLYGCIKTGLYFVNCTENIVAHSLKNNKYQYLLRFYSESNLPYILGDIQAPYFKYDYYKELLSLVSSTWHPYSDGNLELRLLDYQQEYAYSPKKRLRVLGVAGSGKTQVVANRAVYQHLTTGKKVLILTFNISLIQYIRMRIGQVPADFAFKMFDITNFHQFFLSKVNQYIGSKSRSSTDDVDCFKEYANQIERYQSIIIDEVQDFRSEWISIIVRYFLAPDGSISLFGDNDQNIYDRLREEGIGMPKAESFSGPWHKLIKKSNGKENHISYRLPPKIAKLVNQFAHTFISDHQYDFSSQLGISFNDYQVKYAFIECDNSTLAKHIRRTIDKYQLKPKDVTVLGNTIACLRPIAAEYSKLTNEKCTMTFESEEEFNNVNMLSKSSRERIIKELEDIRRSKKVHFTTMTDNIKFATIHSFKGWESDTIFLLIEKESNISINYPALLYTAMTRARQNLYIINLGNTRYDSFFKSVL